VSVQRYSVAAIQTDLPLPASRNEMKPNTTRMLELLDMAVTAYSPFLPVRLVVFPEFAHSGPAYPTLKELRRKIAVEIPNEHIYRIQEKCKELAVYVQTGSMLELDPDYPGAVFNTTCLVGPRGILLRYRKVYPWIPWEVHTSPHDIKDYKDEIFPVAETEIGRIGAAICYDWLFPEVIRQLVLNGAEILIRVSAYMDPFGSTPPTDWWVVVNRCRALENVAFVVASNQAATMRNFPPFSWPGGSMIVDFDGRIVSQATPGSGEQITVGSIELASLRQARRTRLAHIMPVHLRAELHPGSDAVFPGEQPSAEGNLSYDLNRKRIESARRRVKGW